MISEIFDVDFRFFAGLRFFLGVLVFSDPPDEPENKVGQGHPGEGEPEIEGDVSPVRIAKPEMPAD